LQEKNASRHDFWSVSRSTSAPLAATGSALGKSLHRQHLSVVVLRAPAASSRDRVADAPSGGGARDGGGARAVEVTFLLRSLDGPVK
jgi:hypothetical protein